MSAETSHAARPVAPSSGLASGRLSPATFFGLVFAMSLPFWVAGAETGRQALPGLPAVDAFIVLCPLLAACALAYRGAGAAGLRTLLARALDHRRIRPKWWYGPVLLTMPAATAAAYAVMRATGAPLPAARVARPDAPLLFLAFVAGGMAEEVGWSGYATDALRARWGPLGTGVALGVVGAAWHVVQLVQVGRTPTWIGWWCVWSVAQRVVVVRYYEGAGRSVFAAALFHATANLGWQLFPNHGSHWDPRANGLVLAGIAAIVSATRRAPRRAP